MAYKRKPKKLYVALQNFRSDIDNVKIDVKKGDEFELNERQVEVLLNHYVKEKE